MIKIFNLNYIYKLINEKFVNPCKILKKTYLGISHPKLGLTKNFFISNHRLNSSISSLEFKSKEIEFFSTSAPIFFSANKTNINFDLEPNLESAYKLDKALGVERYKFQSFPFHLVEQSPWYKVSKLYKIV